MTDMPRSRILVAMAAILMISAGCDNAYKYLFFPPEIVQYTLIPDFELMPTLNDTSYTFTRDSSGIVFGRGSFKVEVKYVSDYQLNHVEFPDESKDAEFSSNPFTFANWVDPQLGFTPNRFSVFKVSIYNYTASKLNLDPERTFLVSDRGDMFIGYGREEKSSKNPSLEGYFRRRKGASGVDDEIFERRMGIIRTTVLYLGRPVYAGDNREGFVVYDALPESVEKVKLVFRDFILGYDENNEPSNFVTLTFYFKRVPLRTESIEIPTTAADTSAPVEYQQINIHQLRYRPQDEEDVAAGIEEWNSQPAALPALAAVLQDSLKIKANIKSVHGDSPELADAPVIVLIAGPSDPVITEIELTGISDAIKRGSTLFIDNGVFSTKYTFATRGEQILEVLAAKLGDAKVYTLPPDHPVYRSWKKIQGVPEGMDDRENMPSRRDYLTGLMWKNRTVAILSTKGYSMIWGRRESASTPAFTLGANLVHYALSNSR